MNSLLPLIANIGFIVIAGAISLIAALGVYIYVRYGQDQKLSTLSSLIFIAFFVIGLISSYAALRTVINFYA